MTRTPAFNRDSVLNAALGLFWENGFNGTSLTMLEQATGLRPGSIYNSFGSKKVLFLLAIEHYIKGVVEQRVGAMVTHADPIVGIRQFFYTAFEGVPVSELYGCLLTNTATEDCISDAEIRKAVKVGVSTIESGFLRCLMQAQKSERLSMDSDVASLAIHLTSCFQGLEVMARLNRNKKQLRALSEMALSTVTSA